jgi:hypothetical protein
VIGFAVGGALILGGISFGALKGAIQKEGESRLASAAKELINQLTELPESFLSGVLFGLLASGVQRAIARPPTHEQVKQFADTLIKENKLPLYSNVTLNPDGKIVLQWNNTYKFQELYPKLFQKTYSQVEFPTSLRVELSRGSSTALINMSGYDGFEGYRFIREISAKDIGITKAGYPITPLEAKVADGICLSGAALAAPKQ